MTRTTTLARAILDRLRICQPYALPEEQLATEVNGVVRPPAKATEFAAALQALNTAEAPRIVLLRDDFDPESRKWLITEAGEAALLR
ncbi:MAG TPA: hypothetical protein VK961_21340 [Chthoniobacter sp.]|nr:hypothetical protein [Chthoniobacter sp.]